METIKFLISQLEPLVFCLWSGAEKKSEMEFSNKIKHLLFRLYCLQFCILLHNLHILYNTSSSFPPCSVRAHRVCFH
jgi:hypothetical protein